MSDEATAQDVVFALLLPNWRAIADAQLERQQLAIQDGLPAWMAGLYGHMVQFLACTDWARRLEEPTEADLQELVRFHIRFNTASTALCSAYPDPSERDRAFSRVILCYVYEVLKPVFSTPESVAHHQNMWNYGMRYSKEYKRIFGLWKLVRQRLLYPKLSQPQSRWAKYFDLLGASSFDTYLGGSLVELLYPESKQPLVKFRAHEPKESDRPHESWPRQLLFRNRLFLLHCLYIDTHGYGADDSEAPVGEMYRYMARTLGEVLEAEARLAQSKK